VTMPRRLHGHPMAGPIVDPILRTADRFVAIEWFGNGARIMQSLSRLATAAGYKIVYRGFGGVRVAFFTRKGGERRP